MKRTAAFFLSLCLLLSCCAVGVRAADKVYALTMGVRKYDVNNTVSDGSSVAVVTYTRLTDGSSGSTNKLFDLAYGEEFDLTAVPAEGQETYYMFIGWFNGDGELLSRETTLHVVIDGSKAVFAAYVEIANRHVFTYTCTGEGKMSVSSDKAIMQGDGCASVLDGANVTVKFSPAKKYSVIYLRVNGERVYMTDHFVRSFGDAVRSGKIKDVFNALLNMIKFLIGKDAEYTVRNVRKDTIFEVGFMKDAF